MPARELREIFSETRVKTATLSWTHPPSGRYRKMNFATSPSPGTSGVLHDCVRFVCTLRSSPSLNSSSAPVRMRALRTSQHIYSRDNSLHAMHARLLAPLVDRAHGLEL